MTYDRQSSYQQPWLSAPGPGPGALSPLDAEKSKRWRLVLGCSSLFLGLLLGFNAYTTVSSVLRSTTTVAASGGYINASDMSHAVAIIAIFCVLGLAYISVGTWNIVARHAMAKAPLIAAVILAAAAFILIIVLMTTKSTGGVEISALGLNALVIYRCAIVLRMKKVQTDSSAAERTN